MPLFPIGPKSLRRNGLAHRPQSDQLACLQISHFRSFQFLPRWHLFLPYTRGKESLVDIPFIPIIKSPPLLHFHRRLDKIFDILDSLKSA
jgi:hypothetical protein